MATITITSLLLLLIKSTSSASLQAKPRAHIHGSCTQLTLPIYASVDSAVYHIPRVNNDIDTQAWTIWSDTWDKAVGPTTILKNTTTSGTFGIHAQLCVPTASSEKSQILQIATHGAHYDSRYWDSELDPENHSYVEAALKAGYSILTYDRLGAGQSDHPDAYGVVQAPLELELLRQISLMARNGTLYSFAGKAAPSDPAFKGLARPDKVVHVGHSFGSVLTSAFIAKYGNLSDGAIITGWLLDQYLGSRGMATFMAVYANTSTNPPFDRPSGYVVCQKSGIQYIFFAGNTSTAYTPQLLDYGNAIKAPVPIGEFASAYHVLGLPGPTMKGPIQYFLAEFDTYICGGDCKGLANETALKQTYPNAATIEVAIQPNTGHAFPLHNNATAGFQVNFDFLARNGL